MYMFELHVVGVCIWQDNWRQRINSPVRNYWFYVRSRGRRV